MESHGIARSGFGVFQIPIIIFLVSIHNKSFFVPNYFPFELLSLIQITLIE
jgi:hypothetical protein